MKKYIFLISLLLVLGFTGVASAEVSCILNGEDNTYWDIDPSLQILNTNVFSYSCTGLVDPGTCDTGFAACEYIQMSIFCEDTWFFGPVIPFDSTYSFSSSIPTVIGDTCSVNLNYNNTSTVETEGEYIGQFVNGAWQSDTGIPQINYFSVTSPYGVLISSIASGTASAVSGITDNLPVVFGFGVLVIVIFLIWNIFRRFVGRR